MATNNDLIYVPIEDWQLPTLTNAWVNVGGNFSPAGYYKDPFGICWLRGLITGGAGTIFVLPTAYRPALYRQQFVAIANNAFARVDVLRNGEVALQLGSNVNLSLDGLCFRI